MVFNTVHLVGLGGTGCNILESFVRHLAANPELLRPAEKRVALLAFDVAQHDIEKLKNVMEKELTPALRASGIPREKVSLVADFVRPTGVEALFNFVQRWPEFYEEGPAPAEDRVAYRPFLDRAIDLPPVVGGVGRQRAVAKSYYGMNYHLLRFVDPKMELFKQTVLSTSTPIVWLAYGMGGGSGSGMALDFARHLRKRLGLNIPIYGLGILPCSADDSDSRIAAFASLVEHEALLDAKTNRALVGTAGASFENPFNFFLTVPLGPARVQGGSLPAAHRNIDDAIVAALMTMEEYDMNDTFSKFDPAGAPEGKWVNALAMLEVTIPVREHIEIAKLELRRLPLLKDIHDLRKSIYGDADVADGGALGRLLDGCDEDLVNAFRFHLTLTKAYDDASFGETMAKLRRENSEAEKFARQLFMSQLPRFKALADDLARPVRALGLEAGVGDAKQVIHNLAVEVLDTIANPPRDADDFQKFVAQRFEDLDRSQKMTDKLTATEIEVLRRLKEASTLVSKFLALLRRTEEIASLTNQVLRELQIAEITDREQAHLRNVLKERVKWVKDFEIHLAHSLLVSMLVTAEREVALDEITKAARDLMHRLGTPAKDEAAVLNTDRLRLAKAKAKREKLQTELAGWLVFGQRRRQLEKTLAEATLEHSQFSRAVDEGERAVARIAARVSLFNQIKDCFGPTGEYRKKAIELVKLKSEIEDKLAENLKDRGLYNRVKEMTEEERLRILQRVLEDERFEARGDVASLIVDPKHLEVFLRTTLSSFRNPSTLGFTGGYRTDRLWFVAMASETLWKNDLESYVKASLAGYVARDVEQTITIRHVSSRDPYRMRFLLFAGSAAPSDLDAYADIRMQYDNAMEQKRLRAHALALERRGVLDAHGEGVPLESPYAAGAPTPKVSR